MFTIIGGDGKEYGPVSVEQLRTWLEAGRASLETQAKKIGEESWRRLGDFPEFAPPREETTLPPPIGAPIDPKVFADALIARAATLEISDCLDRSWKLLKANFWSLVGVTFLLTMLGALLGQIPKIGLLLSLLLGGALGGGHYFYYLKKVRGQAATINDAFSGFTRAFLPLMLASLVSTLLTALGFCLLILPGIYLAVAYGFTYLLIIDRKMEFWTAMEVSRRVISAQWWRMFGLLILGTLLAALGIVLLFVGIFITLPILIGAIVYAYEDLCNPVPRSVE